MKVKASVVISVIETLIKCRAMRLNSLNRRLCTFRPAGLVYVADARPIAYSYKLAVDKSESFAYSSPFLFKKKKKRKVVIRSCQV